MRKDSASVGNDLAHMYIPVLYSAYFALFKGSCKGFFRLALQDGFTPQAVAAKRNHSQVVTLLTENDTKNKNRLQALHAAAKKDDVNAAWSLLRGDGRSNKVRVINFWPFNVIVFMPQGSM